MSKSSEMNHSSFNGIRPSLKRKCKNSAVSLKMSTPKQPKTQKTLNPVMEVDFSKQKTFLMDLPSETLSKIMEQVSFDDLFNLECVNKRLKSVVKKLVWPTKDTLSHESIIKYTDYPKLSLFANTEKINKRHNITNNSVKAILSRTNILHLDLSIYHSTIKSGICKLLSMASQLLTLNLSFIQLEKNDLLNIAKFCPLLEEISFAESFDDDKCTEGLKRIFIKCPNIKYLNLSDCGLIENLYFPKIPPKLQYLNVSNCEDITSRVLTGIAKKAPNLETLILKRNRYVSNLNKILNNFTTLRYFHLSCFRAENGLELDFSNFKKLEMLTLRDFVSLEMMQTLQHCTKLKALDLNFKPISDDNEALEILKTYKNLRYCKLRYCENFDKLIEFLQHVQLEYLALHKCKKISKKIVKSLLTECDSLSHLEFRSIDSLNYKAIEQTIINECPFRSNILKLVIDEPDIPILKSKWCEIFPIKIAKDPSPFAYLTDVKMQYHRDKVSL